MSIKASSIFNNIGVHNVSLKLNIKLNIKKSATWYNVVMLGVECFETHQIKRT